MKQIADVNVDGHEYEWYEMGFFTKWASPNSHIVLCFDIPQSLLASLTKAVSSSSMILDSASIYSLHIIIIDEVLKLFDTAIWSIRDVIRKAELVDISSNFNA